jgi:hypothetical protein
MKKLVKSVLMLSIASLAILSSCKKDDANSEVTDVTVTITTTPASPVTEGADVVLTIVSKGNTDNKLKSISVKRTHTSGEVTLLSKSLTGTSSTEEIKDSTVESGSYTYTVAVTGEKGSPATKTITVTTIPAPGTIDKTSNPVPLFGSGNGAGTNPNFMKLTSNFNAYSTSDFAANKANVDLAFYFGDGNKGTLSSPDDAVMQGLFSNLNWTGANATQLFKTSLTVAQFDAIANGTTDVEITSLASGVTAWVKTVTNLSVGNVLLFRTAGGKLGLIKVHSLAGTTRNDAEMNVSVVVQD